MPNDNKTQQPWNKVKVSRLETAFKVDGNMCNMRKTAISR